MDDRSQVFFPSTFNQLFSSWKASPQAIPYAGGTDIIWGQGKDRLNLPLDIICLDKLEELHSITRTERYLEIGSMVKHNQLINLGKIVPEVLSNCLKNIAGIHLRNIATIGGNICCQNRRLDLSAPMAALDAQFELRSAQSSRWVSATRFFSLKETALAPQELLTRIRVPLDQWDYAVYRKFRGQPNRIGKAIVFIMKAPKNVLTNITVVYKTDVLLRNINGESILIGKTLPLSHRVANDFIENWRAYLENFKDMSGLSKQEFVNFLELHTYNLSDF
jgi:CO/xanthine dehydrogenase FAD-binding subunit